jgi:hypothetical protein
MRKNFKTPLFIAALAVFSFISGTAAAQEEKSTLPAGNNFMLEFNFKPFGDNIISFNQFQMKYRVTDNFALRLGLAFDKTDVKLNAEDYPESETMKYTSGANTIKYGILPGIEYHFLKNSKVSPYLGFEFSYFNQSAKANYRTFKQEYQNGKFVYIPVDVKVDGFTGEYSSINFEDYPEDGDLARYAAAIYSFRSCTSYGGNLLAGCDFYFMRNMYVGIEAGLSYNSIKYNKITTTRSDAVEPVIVPSTITGKFGFYCNSALRLGFWF